VNAVPIGSSDPSVAEERLRRERARRLANTWEWWVFAIGLAALGLLVAFDRRQCESWWLWLDNLFVATYTLFFWGHAARCYQLCTNRLPVPVTRWRIRLLFAAAAALAGAFVDHAENFWLLADLSRGLVERCLWPGDGLDALTLAKFRLFGVNCVVAVAWWLAARRAAAAWAAAVALQRDRVMRAKRTRAPEDVRRAALQALFIESPGFRSSRAGVSFSRLAVFRFMQDVLGCADVAARGRAARRISVILSDLALAHQIAPAGDRFVITA
jgi:hypothetical protein